MALVFVENHDSFSYSMINYLRCIIPEVRIHDHLDTPDLTNVSHLVLGPGPGSPHSSGYLMDWLDTGVQAGIPILGICLGHQAIGEYFGAKLIRSPRPIHGEAHEILHTGKRLFRSIPNPIQATRYHSLILESLPQNLIGDAWTKQDEIMALSHVSKPIFGLQFHPESFLTTHGLALLENLFK